MVKQCEHENRHPLYRRERVAELSEARLVAAQKAGHSPNRGMVPEDIFDEHAWLCETCRRLVSKDGALLR